MKAIFVRDAIFTTSKSMKLAHRCGTFIETFARTMATAWGICPQRLSRKRSMRSGHPCTVFMNSRIKQALREAAEMSDISADWPTR